MAKYEAMFIVKPELTEEEKKDLFQQINDTVAKYKGTVASGAVWAERKKLFFPIKKHVEGVYYLLTFSADTSAIKDMRQAYHLNEGILREMFTKLE